MKCLYCDYETDGITEQEAAEQYERHLVKVHPDNCVSENQVLSILEMHLEHQIDIDALVETFFEIRSKISEGYRKRELKERYGR